VVRGVLLADFILIPAIFCGLIIGIYEAILVHRDVSIPTHRFGHMTHALVIAVIATFINFNVPFTLSLLPFLESIPVVGSVIGIRILVGLIMLIKVHGVSAALKGGGMASAGMKETWTHSLLIAALTIIAPYIWPFVAPVLPGFLR
jgi:hypothetical protein